MASQPLQYASKGTISPRRRWLKRAVITFVLLAAVAAVMALPVKVVQSRMDGVTGSMSWKTVWCFGLTIGPRIDASPLEIQLKARGIPWTPAWRFMHDTDRTLLNSPTCFYCGTAPPIARGKYLLGDFATKATDAELTQFVRVMQSGTDDEQTATVNAMMKRFDPPG